MSEQTDKSQGENKEADALAEMMRIEQEQKRESQRTKMGCAMAVGILVAVISGAALLLLRAGDKALGDALSSPGDKGYFILACLVGIGIAIWAWIKRIKA